MKSKFFAAVLLTIVLFGCEKTNDEPAGPVPTPAESVSGTYEASTYNDIISPIRTYPINGQTIRLQISPVSNDTVRVEVNSTRNGFYSPGDPVIYPKVAVIEIICSSCYDTRIYRLYLAAPFHPGTNENMIWFDPSFNAYYTYIPPNYSTNGAVQTMFVRIP